MAARRLAPGAGDVGGLRAGTSVPAARPAAPPRPRAPRRGVGVEIDSGHCPALSRPRELADLLEAAGVRQRVRQAVRRAVTGRGSRAAAPVRTPGGGYGRGMSDQTTQTDPTEQHDQPDHTDDQIAHPGLTEDMRDTPGPRRGVVPGQRPAGRQAGGHHRGRLGHRPRRGDRLRPRGRGRPHQLPARGGGRRGRDGAAGRGRRPQGGALPRRHPRRGPVPARGRHRGRPSSAASTSWSTTRPTRWPSSAASPTSPPSSSTAS